MGCGSRVEEKGEGLIYSLDSVIAEKDGKYALADSLGKLLTEYIYDELEGLPGGFCIAGIGGEYFIVNAKGEKVSNDYGSFEYCYNLRGIVSANGKWGLVDVSGSEIIPVVYDELRVVSSELVAVQKGNCTEIMDIEGRLVYSGYGQMEQILGNVEKLQAEYNTRIEEEQIYWNSVLDRYDDFCISCIEAVKLVKAGGKVPEQYVNNLMDKGSAIKSLLQEASGKMTAAQNERFRKITERYENM